MLSVLKSDRKKPGADLKIFLSKKSAENQCRKTEFFVYVKSTFSVVFETNQIMKEFMMSFYVEKNLENSKTV